MRISDWSSDVCSSDLHISVAGIPLTFGSFAMDGFIPDFDASVVTRVLAAGGTITGKNVMTGFVGGFGFAGERGDYGSPLNTHDPTRVPGGWPSGLAVRPEARRVGRAWVSTGRSRWSKHATKKQ